jgi:hypothetical protein
MISRQFFFPVLLMVASACAQTAAKPIEPNGPAKAPNALKAYAALRDDLPGADGVTVKDFTLEREGATFHFDQGEFYFYAPVEGRVTGAVFVGRGEFNLTVRSATEQRSLALLTKGQAMEQNFTTLAMRFTDGTAEEIRNASAGAAGAPTGEVRGVAEDLANGFRKHLRENLDLRLLVDVTGGGGKGEFFLASYRMSGALSGQNMLFIVDPQGSFHAAPDQVELSTWNEDGLQPWVSSLMQNPEGDDLGNSVQVTDERLDVTFDLTGTMKTSAETTMAALWDGVRVVRLNLSPALRVSGVYGESGAPLDFVQEDKDGDADFAVVLPEPMKEGDTLRLLTVYSGGDALHADGNDTFHLVPGAQDRWYPSGEGGVAAAVNFHMTFHLPKNLQLVATGKQVGLAAEGDAMMKAVWETDAPVPAAGFYLGNFKTGEDKLAAEGTTVDAYADVGLPDGYRLLLQTAAVGNLSSVQALKSELAQGKAAMQIYSDNFGKLPYDHVALAQQSACNYGQNWPMLVSLPICGFWDATVQAQLGLFDSTYWKQVTPHEVSHQWWGNLVQFYNYRDQWMNEGLANYSAGVYVKSTSTKPEDYRDFWKEQQKNLLQKNSQGVRPFDAGPLTMGDRVSNSKSGEDLYQVLMASKGAYAVHMLEILFWSPAFGDKPFDLSMQRFVREFTGKLARTEDFKAAMERSMPHWMDLQGNGKLDWFFNEYVYGTELPHYTIGSDFTVANGITSVHLKLTQSNVSNNFVMLVPIYMEVKDGEVKRMFNVVIHGNSTIDQTIPLGKLPSPAKALLINYNGDILSDN